jgi:hypothetical protein
LFNILNREKRLPSTKQFKILSRKLMKREFKERILHHFY